MATIVLKDGSQFKQALIQSGYVTRIKGLAGIPFSEDQIAEIVVTHDKWNFAIDR